jgi:uncharacterized protein YggE
MLLFSPKPVFFLCLISNAKLQLNIMNKLFLIAGLLLLIITTGFSQTKNFIDQPYIEVNGFADTLITPNQIFIKIVISEKDSKDKVSIEELESKMILAFKSIGIKTEVDLTTSDMLSDFKFYLLKQKGVLKSKEYILKVTDAQTASKVFIQLEDLGISNTSIDRVNHTDLENIRNTCRIRAIENAKIKAISMTKPIMQTLGKAIHIVDNEININNQLNGRVSGISIRGYSSSDKQNYEAPKIEFEKIKVNSTINVKFVLN